MASAYDVAVVGFGPAGAALASLLGQAGHAVVVLERFPQPYGLPRMSTLDGEIARLLQHTGEPQRALRRAIPQRAVELYGVGGQRLGLMDWSGLRSGHPSHLSVHQPDIETAMQERIARHPSVDVRWGAEVVGFDTLEEGGFSIRFRRTEGAQPGEDIVTARYLVGTDGASSTVRSQLGIGMDVLEEHQDPWVLTDFRVRAPLPDGLDHRIYVAMDPDQPYFYGPNGAGRCRTDVRMRPGDPENMADDLDAAHAFAEERVGIPRGHLEVTRRVRYRFRSQVARAMRVGDAFIGGDAAHTMPPFLGQGAGTAMRDAANLAWKLDLVLSGRVDKSLLDSYEAERLEQGSQYVYGSLAVLALVTITDPEEARLRDDYVRDNGAMAFEPDPLEGIVHRSASGALGPQAGHLAPQGRARTDIGDRLLDDVVGHGFQLVSREPLADALGAERLARLTELGVIRVALDHQDRGALTVDEADDTYRDHFAEHGATALIARPDFYTFGLAGGTRETVALVDDLLRQLPPAADPRP